MGIPRRRGAAAHARRAAAEEARHGDTGVDQRQGAGVDRGRQERSVRGENRNVDADRAVRVEVGVQMRLEGGSEGRGYPGRLSAWRMKAISQRSRG